MKTSAVRLVPFLATLLGISCLAACSSPAKDAQQSPVRRYELPGEVLGLDGKRHIATIKGEKIEGFMEAMTMEYAVKDAAEFQTLHEGDRIIATLFVQGTDSWIGEIRHQPRKK
jgi:Cu/Ag efflux protein CusF